MICFYFFQETDHTIFIFDYQLYGAKAKKIKICLIHSQLNTYKFLRIRRKDKIFLLKNT